MFRDIPIRERQLLFFVLVVGCVFRLWLAGWTGAVGGDGEAYDILAHHLLEKGCFSLSSDCSPTMIRTPGYPAFVALIYSVAGRDASAVWLVQALVDTVTVAVIYATARILANPSVARLALILGAFCPFTSVYAGRLLAETPATLLSALSTLGVALSLRRNRLGDTALIGGSLGLGCLLRPETLIFAVIVGGWFVARKRARTAALVAILAFLPSAAWATRNWLLMGRVGIAETGGVVGVQPDGFFAWVRTWHDSLSERDSGVWPYWTHRWSTFRFPADAFENDLEKQWVASLIEMASRAKTDAERREIERGFARLAGERAARRPVKTYLWLPIKRAINLWLNSRTEAFPLPAIAGLRALSADSVAKVTLAATNIALVVTAAAGAATLTSAPAAFVLLAPIVFRTAFFSFWAGMEARYVLPAFPTLLILAAIGLMWGGQVAERLGAKLAFQKSNAKTAATRERSS